MYRWICPIFSCSEINSENNIFLYFPHSLRSSLWYISSMSNDFFDNELSHRVSSKKRDWSSERIQMEVVARNGERERERERERRSVRRPSVSPSFSTSSPFPGNGCHKLEKCGPEEASGANVQLIGSNQFTLRYAVCLSTQTPNSNSKRMKSSFSPWEAKWRATDRESSRTNEIYDFCVERSRIE